MFSIRNLLWLLWLVLAIVTGYGIYQGWFNIYGCVIAWTGGAVSEMLYRIHSRGEI